MTPTAIVFLIVAAGVLWGGLAWSLLRLRNHPETLEDEPPST
ncbi:methionine/alanine import family NSS transporter small subunit [Microbacterium sp. Sa4CUA7]|uniref:Methionine/alanine import family NSS transporter small subunit n=1 Tax=Microbacterium pullorum TaxID=2762236 RepID=A0ABR8RYL3_9MICO|nr:methionine/alanine import family NSS transporter small subunit [Microbacterium pullorum]MBD7956318.1 methionine/alanine import family NSS transporter small subunit [Microbacterium pullorum]